MSGTDDKERAAQNQLQQQKAFQTDLQSGKYNIANPYTDYQNPYDFNDIQSQLDKIFGGQADLINNNTNEAITTQQNNNNASFASKGITGSALDTVNSGTAADIK